MYYRLLLTVFFCSFFTTVLSIKCYGGAGKNCMLLADVTDCGGDDGTCFCSKYSYTCTTDDLSCTKSEQNSGAVKWTYAVASQDTCDDMTDDPDTYNNAVCCSTDKCNKPTTGKCTTFFGLRKAFRKRTNVYNP